MRIIILALLSLLLVSCDQNPDFSKIKSSAERGDADDQYLLGLMYDYGEGIPENDAEAAKWYRLAAERGISDAQFHLGVMYLLGEGVPANDLEAIEWFRLAAKQGDERAQYNLGIYYEQAIGVPNNFLTAYVLFSVSAAQGDQRAKEHMEFAKNSLTNEQEAQGMTLVKACIESYYKDCPVIGDNAFIGDNAISLRLLLENLRSDDKNEEGRLAAAETARLEEEMRISNAESCDRNVSGRELPVLEGAKIRPNGELHFSPFSVLIDFSDETLTFSGVSGYFLADITDSPRWIKESEASIGSIFKIIGYYDGNVESLYAFGTSGKIPKIRAKCISPQFDF